MPSNKRTGRDQLPFNLHNTMRSTLSSQHKHTIVWNPITQISGCDRLFFELHDAMTSTFNLQHDNTIVRSVLSTAFSPDRAHILLAPRGA